MTIYKAYLYNSTHRTIELKKWNTLWSRKRIHKISAMLNNCFMRMWQII